MAVLAAKGADGKPESASGVSCALHHVQSKKWPHVSHAFKAQCVALARTRAHAGVARAGRQRCGVGGAGGAVGPRLTWRQSRRRRRSQGYIACRPRRPSRRRMMGGCEGQAGRMNVESQQSGCATRATAAPGGSMHWQSVRTTSRGKVRRRQLTDTAATNAPNARDLRAPSCVAHRHARRARLAAQRRRLDYAPTPVHSPRRKLSAPQHATHG